MQVFRNLAATPLRRHFFKFSTSIHEIKSEAEFNKKIAEIKAPIVVDFHATWCGPCKVLMPRLTKKAAAANGNWHLLKVDIDDNEALANRFRVAAVPTLVLIKDGKTVATKSGALSEDAIDQFVKL